MPNDTSNRPTHNLYIVTEVDGESQWVEIGGAWPNKDGKGFSFKFKLYPRTGDQMVMRVRTERE